MSSLKRALIRALPWLTLPIDALVALLLCFVAYRSRRAGGQIVAVVWGPTPLKPISFNSRALRRAGMESRTSVNEVYSINRIEDFDEYLQSFSIPVPYFGAVVGRYRRFASLLERFDVFITCFDGGFLSDTNLRFFEHLYLRIGRKLLIVWPYGADTYVPSLMNDKSFRDGLLADYPHLEATEGRTRRQITYFSKHADVVIANVPHDEAVPRKDVLTIACYCVDTEEWCPDPTFRHLGDGSLEKPPVKILHCPNHRNVKGTPHLIRAVETLRSEGLNVDLEIVEHVSNDEVRERMRRADIVAAQVLYGYASTEIEAMSLAKPVISNLENRSYYEVLRRQAFLGSCPIVSVSPASLADGLRRLIINPGLRHALGTDGRGYVERFHSLPAQANFWLQVIAYSLGDITASTLQQWWRRPAAIDGQAIT
jgi:glycosyltransferase involved in cell wall biosynthesis